MPTSTQFDTVLVHALLALPAEARQRIASALLDSLGGDELTAQSTEAGPVQAEAVECHINGCSIGEIPAPHVSYSAWPAPGTPGQGDAPQGWVGTPFPFEDVDAASAPGLVEFERVVGHPKPLAQDGIAALRVSADMDRTNFSRVYELFVANDEHPPKLVIETPATLTVRFGARVEVVLVDVTVDVARRLPG